MSPRANTKSPHAQKSHVPTFVRLFAVERIMTDHEVQRPKRPLLPKQAHRISFVSRHALPSEQADIDIDEHGNYCSIVNHEYDSFALPMMYLLRHATRPILDVWLTALLVYVKPSHRCTRLIRWLVIQIIIILMYVRITLMRSMKNNRGGSSFNGKDDDECLNASKSNEDPMSCIRGDLFIRSTIIDDYWLLFLLTSLSILLAWLNRNDLTTHLWGTTDNFTRNNVWMDPTVIHINRLPMTTSSLRRWSSVEEARDAACTISLLGTIEDIATASSTTFHHHISSNSLQQQYHHINALRLSHRQWDFKLFSTVQQGLQYTQSIISNNPTKAGKNERFKDDSFVQIPVPSNWTLQPNVDDNPIYTNRKYPFPCYPPYVPQNNPTGLYRYLFSLPKDWDVDSSTSYSIMFQ